MHEFSCTVVTYLTVPVAKLFEHKVNDIKIVLTGCN